MGEQPGLDRGPVPHRAQAGQLAQHGPLVLRVGETQPQVGVRVPGDHVGAPAAGDRPGVDQHRPAAPDLPDPQQLVHQLVDGAGPGLRVERCVRLHAGHLDPRAGAPAPAGLQVTARMRRLQAEHERRAPGLRLDQAGGGRRADLLVGDHDHPDRRVRRADRRDRREQGGDAGLGVVDARPTEHVAVHGPRHLAQCPDRPHRVVVRQEQQRPGGPAARREVPDQVVAGRMPVPRGAEPGGGRVRLQQLGQGGERPRIAGR